MVMPLFKPLLIICSATAHKALNKLQLPQLLIVHNQTFVRRLSDTGQSPVVPPHTRQSKGRPVAAAAAVTGATGAPGLTTSDGNTAAKSCSVEREADRNPIDSTGSEHMLFRIVADGSTAAESCKLNERLTMSN